MSIIILDEEDSAELTLKAKLGRLYSQIGDNYQLPKGKGFVLNGLRCSGALKPLGQCFYKSNFKPLVRRRGTRASSRAIGVDFHRQIYHYYMCTKTKCLCKQRFGRATRTCRKDSPMYNRLKAFRKFLRDSQWQVLDCEMVVGMRALQMATSIDVVCVDNLQNPKKFFIVELKTGYTSNRHTARTTDKTNMMKGIAGRDIPNSYANHHQLQLWFCVEALQQTYEITPSQAVVVYIEDTGKYKADFAKTWWFSNARMMDKLYSQLRGF